MICYDSLVTGYKEYLTNNIDVMNLRPIQATIQSISSSLMIINNCYITDQLSFISSYLSNVTLDGIEISGITTDVNVIKMTQSSLVINNVTTTKISTVSTGMFLNVVFETVLSINDLYHYDCQAKLLQALSSNMSIHNSVIYSVNIEDDLIIMNC